MSEFRLVLVFASACASGAVAPLPDASTVPRTATGSYALTSQLDLATIPPQAAAMLSSMSEMIDGPDDPSRYLLDRLIDALPAGEVQTIARDLAPAAAAYLQTHLEEAAPRLVPGLRAISDGLTRSARRFGTIETLRISPDNAAQRVITAVTFAPDGVTVPIVLSDRGLADVQAGLQIGLDAAGGLSLGHHAVALPYGPLLRLALDRAVIPGVVPGIADLAAALRDLVDCTRIGTLLADDLIGPASLYEAACATGLSTIASDLYAQLAAADAPLSLELTGVARALDRDGDQTMDAFDDGAWTGAASGGALGIATFWGARL